MGLFQRIARRLCLVAFACMSAFADEVDENVYEKNVASGATVDLTAEEVAAAAGKTFVKTGLGTLTVGDVMAEFTGDIRIREGYYVTQTSGALGTAAGKTYVAGGTLLNRRQTYTSNGTDPVFKTEEIHLSGTGCDNAGALYNKVGCVDFARQVVLDGDTLIATELRLDFRSTQFNMNSHKLTVKGHGGGAGFYLVGVTLAGMGDIELVTGYLEFQSSILNTLATATVTVRANGRLSFWNSSQWLNCRFVLEPGVVLQSSNGLFHYAGTTDRNIVSDTSVFEMQGMLKNDLTTNMQWQIRGLMTGAGGIQGGRGGYLQLFCPSNDFTGGLDISGDVIDGRLLGGIVAYANGAIPHGEDFPPLKLKNASLQLRDKLRYDLPDFVADGRVVVSNMATVTNCAVRSVRKTGMDELTILGPFNVTGPAVFDAGTVRLVKRTPPGLVWHFGQKEGTSGRATLTERGLDTTGVGYAYKVWPHGIVMGYKYTGFIRIPGEEGTPVTLNFVSSIARNCKVTIGDTVCAWGEDLTNKKDGTSNTAYTRFFMYLPVTLTAGWHPITVEMSNSYNTTRGPQENTGLGWVADFGIGVDWQGRGETNSANYAKLLDPGDGSFLRPTFDVAASRASFAGPVSFGPGVVFDVGDVAPYVPVEIPSLTGLPTVRNGALEVASATWTIRKGDMLKDDNTPRGQPLTLEGDAAVTFPAGTVTVDLSAEDVAALKQIHKTTECPIIADVSKFAANTFVLSTAAQECGFRLRRQDGKLLFAKTNGMVIIFR